MINYPSKEATEKLNQQSSGPSLTGDLNQNISLFKQLFKDDDTFITRSFVNKYNDSLQFCLLYSESVVNAGIMNDSILKPLMMSKIEGMENNESGKLDTLLSSIVIVNQAEKSNDIHRLIEYLTYGDSVLLVNGESEALILNSKSIETRGLTEPSGEQILSGPRDGFNESIMTNLSLVRRRVRSNNLKMKYYTFGRQTNTKACICYIDGIADNNILNDLYNRLSKIDIDGVLDTNYIKEIIKDNKWSLFPTIGITERPDVVVGKLLEGRIAIFVDGTPVVLTLPYLFIENFQSNEDYYIMYFYTSFYRLIRLFGFFLTVMTPAMYVAMGAYHQEMLPAQLFISIAAARQSVPLPAAIEAFVFLIVFDILKETGIRMPSNMGQALSIVGALVIGQAAVQAKLVAAPMIIIVSITAITSLLVPKINAPAIYIRYGLMILASGFGYFGLTIGACAVLIHTLSIKSFGVPYLNPVDKLPFNTQDLKDTWVRAPWWVMKTRGAASPNKNRMNHKQG